MLGAVDNVSAPLHREHRRIRSAIRPSAEGVRILVMRWLEAANQAAPTNASISARRASGSSVVVTTVVVVVVPSVVVGASVVVGPAVVDVAVVPGANVGSGVVSLQAVTTSAATTNMAQAFRPPIQPRISSNNVTASLLL